MDCKQFRRVLTRTESLADLPAGPAGDHLAACPGCARLYATERQVRQELRALAGWHAPAGLESSVLARLTAAHARWWQSLRLRYAAAGATVMAAAAAAALYWGPSTPPPTAVAHLDREVAPLVAAYAEYSASGVTGDSGIGLLEGADEGAY